MTATKKSDRRARALAEAERVLGVFLKLEELAPHTGGASRATIWRWIAEGRFPKPIKVGPNSSAWLLKEVAAWQAARIAERDAPKRNTQRKAA